MWDWKKVKEKAFEIGGKIIGGIAESFGLSFGKKVFGIAPHGSNSNHDSAIAAAISSNSSVVKVFTDTQNSLVAVQNQQNDLKRKELVMNAIISSESLDIARQTLMQDARFREAELAISVENLEIARQKLAQDAQLARENLAQQADLACKERELKEKLCEITCNLQRELQQNEFQNRGELQALQIQAKWDEKELPTIFSRRELTDIFAQKSDSPLFICSKIQITEGSPKYFQTELAAELESKMLTFANSTFRRDVRFYSRFFKDRDVFDVNAAQLETILPNTPCVMSFSKLTRSNVHFHYKLWGSQIAEILHEHYDLEFSWREEFLQPLLDSVGEVSDHDLDNIYEMIGDWLTALQKLIATFLMDLYAIVDGDNPFYIPKLDRVNVGLPEAVREKYIQPYAQILEKIQKERIDAFNEELRRQQEPNAAYRGLYFAVGKTILEIIQRGRIDSFIEELRRKALTFELPNGGGLLEFVPIPASQSIAEFRMSKYPITQRQYQAIMGTNPSYFKDNYIGENDKQCLALDRPVERVSKSDAEVFCKAVNDLAIFKDAKLKILLPTEAQWEYACCDGTDPNRKTKFWFGDNDDELKDHAWYTVNSKSMTHSVKEREDKNTSRNFKLVDMHGNVWEWCADSYAVRGGSWYSSANSCSSAHRDLWNADYRFDFGGFRVVLLSSVS